MTRLTAFRLFPAKRLDAVIKLVRADVFQAFAIAAGFMQDDIKISVPERKNERVAAN
jgi:hypothetical protein